MRRRVHHAIELDQSLRHSRTIWVSLAVIFVPGALGGIGIIVNAPQSPTALWDLLLGVILITVDIFCFGRVAEATRRIKTLRENPNANVRPLPAPFMASLFGPYH